MFVPMAFDDTVYTHGA